MPLLVETDKKSPTTTTSSANSTDTRTATCTNIRTVKKSRWRKQLGPGVCIRARSVSGCSRRFDSRCSLPTMTRLFRLHGTSFGDFESLPWSIRPLGGASPIRKFTWPVAFDELHGLFAAPLGRATLDEQIRNDALLRKVLQNDSGFEVRKLSSTDPIRDRVVALFKLLFRMLFRVPSLGINDRSLIASGAIHHAKESRGKAVEDPASHGVSIGAISGGSTSETVLAVITPIDEPVLVPAVPITVTPAASPCSPEPELVGTFQFLQSVLGSLCNELTPSSSQAPKQTIYTPVNTLCLLILQRLLGGLTLAEMVSRAVGNAPALFPHNKRVREGKVSSNPGAYARARERLPLCLIAAAFRATCQRSAEGCEPTFQGMNAYTLDGTTLKLEPTEALQKEYPPARNQMGESVWPIMMLSFACDVLSGSVLEAELGAMYGKKNTSESLQGRQIIEKMPAGSVVLADSGYGI